MIIIVISITVNHFSRKLTNFIKIKENDLEEIVHENRRLVNEFKGLQEENVDLLIQIKNTSTKLFFNFYLMEFFKKYRRKNL